MHPSEHIAHIPLFAGLSAAALRELAAGARERRFAAGEMLWMAGDQPHGLFVVLSGEVRIVRSHGDRQYVVHAVSSGETLGEVPLFADGGYPATAVAHVPTLCLVVSVRAVRAAMAVDAALGGELLQVLADRVRALASSLESLATRTVRSRLAAYLLSRSTQSASGTLNLGGTQQDVAEELGTVREVVARELSALGSAGILEAVAPGTYRIIDEAELARIAGREGG